MRRVSAKCVKPGMVLGRAVYDSRGNLLFEAGAKMGVDSLRSLTIQGVREVLVEDWRVSDVPVQPLVAPNVESEAVQALRQLMTESRGASTLDELLVKQLERPLHVMIQNLFPEVIGEVNVAGCTSPDDFMYFRPVKVAEMSFLMGKRAGYKPLALLSLGLAALLMDVGFILLPSGALEKEESLQRESRDVQKHPELGATILSRSGGFGPDVVQAVLQHHERWNGSGYSHGLRGKDICLSARIIAIADAYYELVSERPGRKAYLPHEAAEYVMAYSGDLFDPDLVGIFARQVPLYPTGVAVKLNTGAVGIITDGNSGHIGRPVVRICYDSRLHAVEPYDINLANSDFQHVLVVQVLDY